MNYGTIGQEGCACGDVEEDGIKITTHCHRTGRCCEYAGVHIVEYPKGKLGFARSKAKALAKWIGESYCCGVEVKVGDRY